MELPTDVFVDILLRLPPSSRRLTRLVCRQWRDVVDTRTTEMQSRAKPLVVTNAGSAYVVDDLSAETHRVLWTKDKGTSVVVVGTCNGLVCLCDDLKAAVAGAVILFNPVTGETVPVPPPPWFDFDRLRDHRIRPHQTYGFAYHPTTGQYKIVHVPYFYGSRQNKRKYHVVRVLTLGEQWWRDVATAPSASCEYGAGIVAVDGSRYWVAEGTRKVMAFDLDDERLAFIEPPPLADAPSHTWHLTEVHGRLGIVCSQSHSDVEVKLEVWVREGSAKIGEDKWSRRYMVQMDMHSWSRSWHLTRPNFAHSGYLLTERLMHSMVRGSICGFVYKHKPSDGVGMVEISQDIPETIVLAMKSDYSYRDNLHCQVFTYVETTEPISGYNCWSYKKSHN